MSTLPARPDLDQLRRQAKDLARAARSGDAAAAARIRAVSDRTTLTAARLAIAREHGFPSWARLKDEVLSRTSDEDERARVFCRASISDATGRAARMLAASPELATYGLPTAAVLGDVDAVRAALATDPAAATRPDPESGWTPLHLVCGSRWHRLDPARAPGLAAVARLLLDAGADPTALAGGHWTPLRCAVAGAANPELVELVLSRGAVPDDHDLYLACFGGDGNASLRLLLDRAPEGLVSATTALAAPISTGDVDAVRLLLAAGADPNRPSLAQLYGSQHADETPWPAVYAAIRCDAPAELIRLLLDAGADPDAAGPDGRTPHQLAARRGRPDLARLVREHGAAAGATEVDLFLSACLDADRDAAQRQLDRDRVRVEALTDADLGTIHRAAETGRAAAVRLMLDLGFPLDARGDEGATPLHTAAYAGSTEVVGVLLQRGADLEARDATWESTPLGWAKVGSGLRPRSNPEADWPGTVRLLLDAGASTDGLAPSPDDPKPASPEVARLLSRMR